MVLLTIDLQAGFQDETVVVLIDDREALRAENVTTDYSIGLARSLTIELPKGDVAVEIVLPIRQVSKSLLIHLTTPRYLSISYVEQMIEHTVSAQPFTYF